MLPLLIVIGRALELALRGHRELVLENLALAAAAQGAETHDASALSDARPTGLDCLRSHLA